MHRLAAAAVLAALPLAALPVAAPAQDTAHYDWVGNWHVEYFPAMRGCVASVDFNDDTSFLIGIDTTYETPQLAIAVLNPEWSGIEDGATYDLTVQFDRRAPWDVTATGLVLDASWGLVITEPVDSQAAADFVGEFQRGNWMTLSYQDEHLGKLSLKDSWRATNSAIECTQRW